ncbi:hypothetical protein RQP46_002048 [Phenoliferia psychrophenolica]
MSDTAEVLRRVRARIEHIMIPTEGDLGFGAAQASHLQLADVRIEGVKLHGEEDTICGKEAKSVVVIKLVIDEGCCNMSGNAHGGYLAWLIDVCSSMAVLALSGPDTWVTSGVSSNINVYYLAAAPLGTALQVVSTVIQKGKATATVECKVEEIGSGKLIALGTHVKVDNSKSSRPKL